VAAIDTFNDRLEAEGHRVFAGGPRFALTYRGSIDLRAITRWLQA
jgi:hypothetical protein